MAQLSTTMSQAQRATAFHCSVIRSCFWRDEVPLRLAFFTSNLFLLSLAASVAADFDPLTTLLLLAGAEPVSASTISTSAILPGGVIVEAWEVKTW